MSKHVAMYNIFINIALSESQKQQAMRMLNKHHTGNEQIPFDAEVPFKLKNAAYRVCMTTMVPATVGVTEQGELEIIQIGD